MLAAGARWKGAREKLVASYFPQHFVSKKTEIWRKIIDDTLNFSAYFTCKKSSRLWSPPLRLKGQHYCDLDLVAAEKRFSDVVWAHAVRGGGAGSDQRLTIYTHVKHAQKFKLSLTIFLQSSVFLLAKCWRKLLAIIFLCWSLLLLLLFHDGLGQ